MQHPNLLKLIKIIEKLRDPVDGCPWDLKQTHTSLLKFLQEESYEFMDAVENGDSDKIKDELGDLLLQVILHATIAKQDDNFNLEDVAENLTNKLIYRHPHIFKKKDDTLGPDEVKENWEKLKMTETKKKKEDHLITKSYLSFPSLFSANRIGEKTNAIKFDWHRWQDVEKVVESEWNELKLELNQKKLNIHRVEEELGDFLFSTAQLARHLKINPEDALRKANRKFLKRFNKMEDLIKKDNVNILQLDQKEMDVYWDQVKEEEKLLSELKDQQNESKS